jgi:hypothetical protein
MPGTWINRIQHVNDGEPVSGAVDSRPTRGLEGNTQYLKDRLDSAELGEGVCAYGETVEAAAAVGMPVYRNSVTAQYERAFAAVVPDPATGVLVPAPSCDCVGIIIFKYNATLADILLGGQRQVDLSAAVDPTLLVDGVALPGRYYLSSATPGMLVQQRPPVSVSVLVYTDDGLAIVQPVQRDFLEDHIHYKVQLYAQPAGTNVISAGRHSVGSPDPTLPGWLPAGHPSFNGRAPTGAAFGYNLAAHPQLSRIFPPIPPSGAVVYLDRGEDSTGGKLVPMGPGGLCSVDSFGIWWMSDCQDDAPWPVNWSAPINDQTGNASSGPECPRIVDFVITLSYTMMVFTTERTCVTSLQPAEGSPLVFTDCDGDPATTGDLLADMDLRFLVGPGPVTGSLVFKELDGATFYQGLVVEGLTAGPGCALSSTNPTPQPGGGTLHQGIVQVAIDTAPAEQELPVDLIRLAQTEERFYLEIPYIGFDPGVSTSLRMRFYVPPDGLPASPMVALRMQLLGRSAGTLPQLTVTYRILPRPQVATNLPDMTAEQAMQIVTNVPVGANQYIEVQGTAFSVSAGDTILVNLVRSNNDGYTDEVGLLRPVGILTGTGPGS